MGLMKTARVALAGLVAMTGAVVLTGAGTTAAPAAVAAAASCGATPSSGSRTPQGSDRAVQDASGTGCDVATLAAAEAGSCDPLGTSGEDIPLPIETGTDYPLFFDVDAEGNIFVTDSETGELVRLTPSASGYERSVVASGLANPTSIVAGGDGVLYVVLYGSSSVVKMTPSGASYTTTTIASGGALDRPAGIDVDAAGDLFVSNGPPGINTGTVVHLDASADYGQEVIATGLLFPHQVDVDDSGNVFIAAYESVVRVADTGAGWAKEDVVTGLGSGQGVAVDSAGTLWISTTEDPGLWTATPAGSGYAPKELYAPWGENYGYTLAFGPDETLFVSAFDRIMTFGPSTLTAVDDTATVSASQTVTTDVRANDPANVTLAEPTVIADPQNGTASVNPDGTIAYTPASGFVGIDSYAYEIRDDASPARVCSVATVSITVSSAQGCATLPATADTVRIAGTNGLAAPTGIAVDANKIIYISDPGDEAVLGWGPGSGPSLIDSVAGLDPQGIAVDAARNVFYADEDEHEIVKMTWSEAGSDYTRSVLATNLQRPSGVVVDAEGNVFFAENSSGHVHRLTPSGGGYTSSLVASGLDRPRGLALDGDGNLYVADSTNDRIVKLTPTGPDYAMSVISTSVESPTGVAVDAAGVVIIGDTGNNRVLRLTPTGTGYDQSSITIWGDHVPTWVAMADGVVLVVDRDTAEVVVIGGASIAAVDDDAGTTTVATPVTTDVRDNDTGTPEGLPLGAPTVLDQPGGGTATVDDDGTITYTPDAGFSGADSYRYEVRDDQDPATVCDAATVSVTVQNVFTGEGQASTPYNTPVTLALADIVTTTGKPLDPARTTLARAAGDGGVDTDVATGDVTYTPSPGFSGDDTFAIQVCDTSDPVQCHEAEVRVTVAARSGPAAAPRISTRAAARATLPVNRAGRPASVRLSDRVTISGFVPGGSSTGRATLYGPVSKVTSKTCTSARAVRTVTFTPRNGTFRTASIPVNEPGYYTWVVSTSADDNNLAARHACGLAAETTLVHRPAVGNLAVEAGYSGTTTATRNRLRLQPASISVPAIRMKAPITAVGARRGTMLIPSSMTRGGWYTGSAAPGEAVGSTVIAGHVSNRRDRPGVFGKLRRARAGQVITVRAVNGTVQRYRITSVRSQPRSRGISGAAVSTTGTHRLTLVTCTGKVTYRNGRFHYTKNLVVTAVPIP